MSIRAFPESPLFSKTFTQYELANHISSLPTSEVCELQEGVYHQAVAEGVIIPAWDSEWGKYHLYDSTARLVRVLIAKKKNDLFHQISTPKQADLIANHCPLILENLLSKKADSDLMQRADFIAWLDKLKDKLNGKYPHLSLCAADDTNSISSAWKGMEIYLLTLPTFLNHKEIDQFKYFKLVIEELSVGNYDTITVQIILDRLLKKESFHPISTDLSDYLQLKKIHKMTRDQIHSQTLQHAGESLWKSVKIIPHAFDRQGKFKPLGIRSATNEVFGADCDRLFGWRMTVPTRLLRSKNIFQSLVRIEKLLGSVSLKVKQNDLQEANLLRRFAFDLLNEPHIPTEVRNSIYSEMYLLSGNNQQVDSLGEKLFYNVNGYSTSDREKYIAIQNYFNSDACKYHMCVFNIQGSIQPWISECGRAYDLIVKDPAGGEKLKTAPKALAHLYSLMGIIKGSMDCSSGNTLIEYIPELGRVVNFWDFDDERSMPTTNNFWDLRMWQLGLPQCAQPFDRAVLLMFLDPSLMQKLMKQQTSLQISKVSYEAQIKRLEKLIVIFKDELFKNEITLTPRDLFFAMFGGREEFDRVKAHFNNDKTYGEERGIRISPIELFEFHISNMGKDAWYTGEESEKTLIGKNMRVLYFPELP